MSHLKGVFDVLNRATTRYHVPNYEAIAHMVKLPMNPKVVLYGTHNFLLGPLFMRALGSFEKVNYSELNKISEEEQQEALYEVAKTLTAKSDSLRSSYVIENFPSTVAQAEKLDQLLDGINLAINVNVKTEKAQDLKSSNMLCESCGAVYNTQISATLPPIGLNKQNCAGNRNCRLKEVGSDKQISEADKSDKAINIKPVLDFYNKRGLLVEVELNESTPYDEAVKQLKHAIESNIKF